MFRKHSISSLLNAVLVLTGVFLFNGCAEKPVPPVFSLYGYQRVAVVPFDNQTPDPGLPGAVQDEMTDEIVSLNAVPVIEAAQVAAYLKSINADPSSITTDSELRKRLGKKFQCDILLAGTASGYNEFLKDTPPQRVSGNEGEAKWGFYTNRKVVVNASAKLMDVASGSLLWSGKNQGYSWYNTFNPLPIPGDVMVPPQLEALANLANLVRNRVMKKDDYEPPVIDQNNPNVLLYPKSSYFTDLRQKAVYQTVNGMAADFRGHGNWTPQLKGSAQ